MYSHTKIVHVFCGAAILLVAFIMMAFLSSADAALMSCRADPIVFLSDGSKVTITAEIATSASNVQKVQYALHAPSGTQVVRVIYTAGGLGKRETFTLYDDSLPGTYVSDTVVTTRNGKVPVKVTTSLGGLNLGVATGYSRDHLIVSLLGSLLTAP
ncbi:MAG: hypothetical protein HZB51_01295 [Chloroflexi bacterium]|nr:hypothetical protein [Chloroflexota bacterium]